MAIQVSDKLGRFTTNLEVYSAWLAPRAVIRLPTAMSMARSAAARHAQHNLPVQATTLLGRDQDASSLRQLLFEGEGRLVTLTGVGGCGKTRLAIGVAFSVIGLFKDGVWLVALAPFADPLLV